MLQQATDPHDAFLVRVDHRMRRIIGGASPALFNRGQFFVAPILPGFLRESLRQGGRWPGKAADVQLRTGEASTVVKPSPDAPLILGEVPRLPARYRYARHQSVASRRPLRMPGLRPRLDAALTGADQRCLDRSCHCSSAQIRTVNPFPRAQVLVAEKLVEFLYHRPVPATAMCHEYQPRRCESQPMMLVRVDGEEQFFCYQHLSLLYNRVTRPRDPHPRMVRSNNTRK